MSADLKLLKKLREETGVSIADIRMALEETGNDEKKTIEWLKKHGIEKADKKAQRETSQGLVEAYVHQNGKIGAVVVLTCETDFVARTEDFKHLAHELAMQVAALNPKSVKDLTEQEYIRDASVKISDLVKQTIAKLGENITIAEIKRFEI
ncbi:MAG: elongation factor Ts [Candidatus Levybacteria bacterium RIFCSPLOWO2_01_FULL_36_13]|nr:MAG: elongation factor Ts [Candidatus Levybacteria bacterium RIFCSPHIGHO2_01_FULL_36_15b]OGH35384.1 MAG: elongation factor Ts [Candidatus Levybacteria bacterium RIFCSPLOWO2_01_FULL_36_13]